VSRLARSKSESGPPRTEDWAGHGDAHPAQLYQARPEQAPFGGNACGSSGDCLAGPGDPETNLRQTQSRFEKKSK
jgi:hypothetical protein